MSSVRRRAISVLESVGVIPVLRRLVRGRPPQRLVISYFFPPAAEASGIVVAKRIAGWATPVDVVANEPPEGRRPDRGALLVAGDSVRTVVRLKGRKNVLKDWSNIERFCVDGMAAIRRLERRQGRYRDVYSRSMMPAAHVLAALHKIRRPGARWSAEFSDPLAIDTHGERRLAQVPDSEIVSTLRAALVAKGIEPPAPDRMFDLVETLVYALADSVVFTNAVQREFMLGLIEDPRLRASVRERSEVHPHPEPATDLYRAVPQPAPFDDGRVNLGYFGAFYRVRALDDLLVPFLGLGPRERRGLRLHVFTDKPSRARQLVEEQGLEDCVSVRAFVPYLEFLALTKQFDWLILADAHATERLGANPYLPSKLSDYLGSGTPIWVLTEPGSPMSARAGLHMTRLGDVDAATSHLRSILATHGNETSRSLGT